MRCNRSVFLFLLALLLWQGGSAFGQQADIAGDWAHPGGPFGLHEDAMDRGGGPDPGQWLGIPFNEAGRAKALSWTASWMSVPEHQCTPHPAPYHIWGPGTLTVRKEYDSSRRLIAYRLDGTYGLDRVIWLDGRPHPSEDAPRTFNGFSTGRWEGDSLLVETSHIKPVFIRRNGAFVSEKVRMIEYFTRHDNYLIHTMAVEDPIYLSEPFVRTTEYVIESRPIPRLGRFGQTGDEPVFYKCFPAEELGGDRHAVPHWLPGTNPLPQETAGKFGIPIVPLLGGAQTMFPEYIDHLKRSGGPAATVPRGPSTAQPAQSSGIRSMHVQGRVWVIMGAGGNVAVQVGDEGVLLVDSGVEAMSDAIRAEIGKIAGDKPIRYVINTHWHPDHTGGNTKLAAGTEKEPQRAAILTHENTSGQLSQNKLAASEMVMDTFFGRDKTIYFNDEAIEIINVSGGHTDGDVIVFFRGSDVVSAGDVVLTTGYPIINAEHGASVDGAIAALNEIIDIAVAKFRQQGGTLIVPGHGRLYDETDVVEYRDMLVIIRDRVQEAIKKGKTLAQIKAESPTIDYDGVFGANSGFWTTDMFIDGVYRSLTGAKQGND
jgi:glyoxylase-like metal-dependent hydrolase (beta-lactamase superfamily II)